MLKRLRPVLTARERLVVAAATLFRRQGYAATGINEVLALSKSPKGSLYHYFPEGKEQLGEEAVRYAGQQVVKTLAALSRRHGDDPAKILAGYAELLKKWMLQSNWSDGCPIGTVIAEIAPSSDRIAAAGEDCFKAWAEVFSTSLCAQGVPLRRAAGMGSLVVSTLEGALIQCKAARSGAPLDQALRVLLEMFSQARVDSRRVADG